MKILKEAVTAHIEGRYELSIPTLLPQIEGIIADINKHAGRMKYRNVKDYVESLFARNSRFDRISKAFFLSILPAAQHRDELLNNWELAKKNQSPDKIEPLEYEVII